MKRSLRMVSVILSLLLALGCLPTFALADQNVAAGGYVETELTLPEGYVSATAPVVTPDGSLALAAMNAADNTWSLLTWPDLASEPRAMALDLDAGMLISSIRIAPDGQLLALLGDAPMGGKRLTSGPAEQPDAPAGGEPSDAPTGNKTMRVFTAGDAKSGFMWLDAEGNRTASGELSGMMLATCALSGRRLAALALENGITVYDEQGKQVSSIAKTDVFGMVAIQDNLLLHQSGKLSEVDPATGKELRSIPFDGDYGTSVAVAPDGEVYAVSSKGILRMAQDGFEQRADPAGYAIGDPSAQIGGACALAGGTLIVQFGGGSGISVSGSGGRTSTKVSIGMDPDAKSQLMVYAFNPDLDLSNRTAFSVTALRDSAKLRKAASDFQKLHPELNVSFSAPIAEGDTETPTEDHIRTLNTELLAGKGGDVLILDGLPVDKYIEKGVLQDLSALAENWGVLPGILSGSRAKDGKLYAAPAQFSFTTIWGREDAIGQMSSMSAISEMQLQDGQSALYGRTPEDWLRLFYPASEASFRGEDGKLNFDTPEFARFLEALYQIYTGQVEQPDDEGRRGLSMKELQAALNGSVALIPGNLSSTMDSAAYYSVSGKQESAVAAVPSLDGEGAAYVPNLQMGINARTQNRELAEDFVNLLFSSELQQMDQGDGLPTVAASLDRLVENAIELSKNTDIRMAMMISGGTEPLELAQPDEAHWRALRALCDRLCVSVPTDETLMGFIVEETAGFFSGAGDAGQAASAVMQRAMAYLNE